MKKVMKRAWEIFRTLLGDYTAKIKMALRMAWAEIKNKPAVAEYSWKLNNGDNAKITIEYRKYVESGVLVREIKTKFFKNGEEIKKSGSNDVEKCSDIKEIEMFSRREIRTHKDEFMSNKHKKEVVFIPAVKNVKFLASEHKTALDLLIKDLISAGTTAEAKELEAKLIADAKTASKAAEEARKARIEKYILNRKAVVNKTYGGEIYFECNECGTIFTSQYRGYVKCPCCGETSDDFIREID